VIWLLTELLSGFQGTRMGTRRLTRLTNAFSRKWENHWAAVSVWYTFSNFCRVHKSLRVTPAMAVGITDRLWDVRELLGREYLTPIHFAH
jgi:hypothetical protein